MTQETRTTLKDGINTDVADGGANTAADVRTQLIDLADSAFILSTDTADNITEGSTNKFFTIEAAQDAVGGAFDSTLVYTDGSNSMGRAAITGDITISAGSNTAAIGSGVIVNADVSASAAIATSKLAALTANRLAITDGSGFLTNNTVTATEAGYLSGVTSAIQTQLDSKQGEITLTTSGSSGPATLIGDTLNIPQYTGGGGGDVIGPGSSTDDAVVTFNGTDGTTIQNSTLLYSSGNLSGMTTITVPNTGLHILDTNASHDLIVAAGSDLTADRTLTITTGDSDRTLTISGNTTISGTNTGDQTTVTGNAGTATALQTARTIGGVSFDGTASIVPQTIQVADAGGDTTTFVLLAGSATGNLQPLTDSGLAYNATTDVLATNISGNAATVTTNANLTGDITSTGNSTSIASGVIINADINASAAIDATKIADGSVTSTEFQYINTLTSNAQTQLNAKASTTQTAEGAGGVIGGALSDTDYRVFLKMPHGGTITETTTRSTAGTATATFKVNTTALGGTANSVSTSEQSQSHSSTNTFAADDDIVITISSNSGCENMSFMIKYTRTLS